LALALSLALALGACGDDTASDSANDDNTSEDGGGAAAEGAFTVTLSADAIEAPEEVAGGIVEVTYETDTDVEEMNFTKVPEGTSDADFRAAVASATTGQAIPEILEAVAGLSKGTQTLELPAGSYFVWTDKPRAEGEEGEEGEEGGEEDGPPAPNPDAFLTKALTVTAGEDGELPDTGSSITAREYSFDVKVTAGGEKFVFRNEGPDQLHHVVLFNFGKVAAADVEENLETFLQSDGEGEPPAAFKDLDMEKLEAGGSGVFTPGLGGTADATFESGNTYAAVCFISDRSGGAPHAFSKGMRTVFTVE
jgi:hypothetical protein